MRRPSALWLVLAAAGGLLLLIAPLSLIRLGSLLTFAGASVVTAQPADVARLLWMGLRFDLKIGALLWIVLLLPAGLLSGLPRHGSRWAGRWLAAAFTLCCLLATGLSAGNHFYYGYYQSPFNPFLFGLVEDDTRIILKTIWQDFPVLRTLLALAIVTALQSWAFVRMRRWAQNTADGQRWPLLTVLVMLPFFAGLLFLARGTSASQPLNAEDYVISTNPLLNDLVPNGSMALYQAWADRQEAIDIGPDTLTGLKALGFATPMAAARELGVAASTVQQAQAALYRQTGSASILRQRPPHVVVGLMESWGMQPILRQGAGSDLLGRMARHTLADGWYTRFVSGRRGTHPSLESLLLNSPLTPLTQGGFGDVSYLASAVKPYKDAGYRTVFLFGGSSGWRNLHRAFSKQYFDAVLDQGEIVRRYPLATFADAGVHDEFLWRTAHDLLSEADSQRQPLMLFVLTTTNHPPYVPSILPASYHPAAIDMAHFPDQELPPAQALLALQALQYSSDALGEFVDAVKAGPLAEHTLIAASGDHHLRGYFRLDPLRDLHWRDRVPLYLRIPAAYRLGGRYDPLRIGSHRDIFPTLYQHSLVGARYLALGEDLLDARTPQRGLSDYQHLYTPDGVATDLLKPDWMAFSDSRWRSLQRLPAPPLALQQAVAQEKAKLALLDWQIRSQARREALP